MSLCVYGCGNEARFTLKNGKGCCSKSHNHCPEIKRKSSERLSKLNLTMDSPVTKKGYKQPRMKCSTCGESFGRSNYAKHKDVCGKPKGNCLNCGVEIYTYNKTCSIECTREIQSLNRKKQLHKNGLSVKCSKFPYIRTDGKILQLESSFELSTATILDIWKLNQKIVEWEYNRKTYIPYYDKSGKERMYYPDFLVTDNNGDNYWLEVKGFKTPTDELKWSTAKDKGISLMTWFEEDIILHQNNISEYIVDKD